uniref:Uncharacterized protein n=1 Tax=Rhizophora mucronata TaxID=61149 RepID=A0A2P2KFZ0_RHIMU
MLRSPELLSDKIFLSSAELDKSLFPTNLPTSSVGIGSWLVTEWNWVCKAHSISLSLSLYVYITQGRPWQDIKPSHLPAPEEGES